MSSISERFRSIQLDNKQNTLWFFVAFIGGGFVVAFTKFAVSQAWVAAVVAAGVVLSLVFYYVFNDEDAPEEEGDNVYYLGLLLTIISLIVTLVELFGIGSETVGNAEKIRMLLQNFGIALTSTVFGIAGRVLVQNLQRREDSAQEPESLAAPVFGEPPAIHAKPEKLVEYNRYLFETITRELTQCVHALAQFHLTVRTYSHDTTDDLLVHSKTLKKEATGFRDVLQQNIDEFTEELQRLSKSTFGSIESSLTASADHTRSAVEQLQSAHDSYIARLDSENSKSLQAINQNFASASKETERLAELLQLANDGFVEQFQDYHRMFLEHTQSLSDQNRGIQENLESAVERSSSLVQRLTGVSERFIDTFDILEVDLGRTTSASKSLDSTVELAVKSMAILEQEIEQLREVLTPLHESAEKLTQTFHALDDLGSQMRSIKNVEESAASVRQIGESLQSIVDATESATEHSSRAMELLEGFAQSIKTAEEEILSSAREIASLATESRESTTKRQRSIFGVFNPRR